ncbi:MAG: LysR family transcriptional regulator [Oscillospiraceae bacterium]
MINYEYYKVFYFACRYKNFTRAAKILGTSQSAVSHTISTLEYQLGRRLFVRSSRGITPTPDGELLFKYVSAGCEAFIRGENELINSSSQDEGTVYIAATEAALNCYLFKALEGFRAAHPNIRFRIESLSTGGAVDAVLSGNVDYALLSAPVKLNKPLVKKNLADFSDVLICGERCRHLQNETLKLEDLKKYPLILLSEKTVTRAFFDEYFSSCGVFITPDIEAATSDMIIPMVKNNLGIGFVPELMPQLSEEGIYRLTVSPPPPVRSITAVYNSSMPKSPAAKAFFKEALEG